MYLCGLSKADAEKIRILLVQGMWASMNTIVFDINAFLDGCYTKDSSMYRGMPSNGQKIPYIKELIWMVHHDSPSTTSDEFKDARLAVVEESVKEYQAMEERKQAAMGSAWKAPKITVRRCSLPLHDHEMATVIPPRWGQPWTRRHAVNDWGGIEMGSCSYEFAPGNVLSVGYLPLDPRF